MKIEVNTHSKNMIRLAKEHPEVVVMSADLGTSCEIKEFHEVFPDRYFSMGIAEQNMCSWAAGMAREGFRPFLHTFSVFLYRRILDQLEMSVAYPNLPVVFVGFVPGITTPGGVTHQSTNDVGVLRTVPNLAIFDIGDATEIEGVLDLAYSYNGPVFIRMLRKEVPRFFPADEPIRFNHARILSEGTDITLLSSSVCTEEALRATAALREKGVSIRHLHVSTLKPFTDPQVVEACQKAKYGVVTIENGTVIGGLGSAVADVMAEHGIGKKLVKVGLQDTYAHGASKMYLLKKYQMDAMTLIGAVENLMGKSFEISEKGLEEIRFEDFSAV
ncbi:1-deoxy-D-xylulose-5-phosphate synthase [Caprobacter fermentans]|uniref:1-deoxy-D-xylulose-5-phosphate synthase n=1 Tax=Caproicibacter fermentans TaxID=2576756 RepID=A0A6N8HY06_9FIRM|nr:transketolase C-terminal domain-containing protein [Caproicibacter fermentans]MVB10706.1 1-deoxy-D-xylulose-5-phosphate synthase [Caproicibacter fermentans]